MKKLLSLIATLGLISTSGTVVVSCNSDDKASDGNATTTKTDLSKLNTKQLGNKEGTTDFPTIDLIVSAINNKNSNYGLKTSDVVIDGTQSIKTIKLKALDASTKFTGSVEVTYSYSKISAKDLSGLPTKELGNFEGEAELPTLDEIVKQINKINDNYGLTSSEVEVDGQISATKTKIKALSTSTKFTGSVEVEYVYTKLNIKDLSTLPIKSLGDIGGIKDLPVLSEIITPINSKNDDWEPKKAEVELEGNPTKQKATLKAKSGSKYFSGKVEIDYSYFKKQNIGDIKAKDLGDIIGKTDLMTSIDLVEIVEVINLKNPGFEI
ncbi:hypothetical protein SLITO_v1c07290 [Spiroplasma litorale]|uniref:Lipoprotein n=1 Tax=Spiroplasma litorale TaxID=216942 RepID=A0A0K1W214_9MOLU|nr:lipoprotein [Spiroplasma litorale]AKX34354.1 hypothetical protein SLITO_v1c07290 [Spiroplasma litorale]